jgi:NIPSNAP
MQRREFLSATLGASLLAGLPAQAAPADAFSQERSVAATTPSFYLWIHYVLRNGPMPKRMTDYLRDALVPAANRLGITPVGVFDALIGEHAPATSVLLPHTSPDVLLTLENRLADDQDYARAADAYLKSSATDPAYVRKESALLQAFPTMPRIEVPAATASKGPRLFELRMYESASEAAHRAKVKMFEELGEIEIFRKVGLTPVFFSRSIVGGRQPNLQYMLVHENLAAREKNWDNFRNSPDWKRVSATPGYADAEIVSNITTTLIRPTAYSQI